MLLVGVIVATHGRFGEELVKAAEMMLGPSEHVYMVSLQGNDSFTEFKGYMEAALEKLSSQDGVLMLADLFGGTPANVAALHTQKEKVHLVTGVNLPMLLEVLSSRLNCTLPELTDIARTAGQNSVQCVLEIKAL